MVNSYIQSIIDNITQILEDKIEGSTLIERQITELSAIFKEKCPLRDDEISKIIDMCKFDVANNESKLKNIKIIITELQKIIDQLNRVQADIKKPIDRLNDVNRILDNMFKKISKK